MSRLILCDTVLDGPTWLVSNNVLKTAWRNPGGDWIDAAGVPQGSFPYHAFTTNVFASADIEFDATILVRKWLADGGGALFVKAIGRDITLGGRTSDIPPRLEIDGQQRACIATTWLAPSAGSPIQTQWPHAPCVIAWDLSGVTSCESAKIYVRLQGIYSGGSWPLRLEFHACDLPEITSDPAADYPHLVRPADPAAQIIASDRLDSEETLRASYIVGPDVSSGGAEFFEENGLRLVRCWGEGFLDAATGTYKGNPRLIQWRKVLQPLRPELNQSWRKPYEFGKSLGYDEVWCRYFLRAGADVRAAFNEEGMKLPGFEGMYNLSTSGEPTLPVPADAGWSGRLWHTKPSDAYPHKYRPAYYWYGNDVSGAATRYLNKVCFLFEAERLYEIVQGIRMNTLNLDGSANADGCIWTYVGGVLVHEQTNIVIRKDPARQIQTFFVNIYHGGMSSPKGRLHYDIGELEYFTAYPGVKVLSEPVPEPTPEPIPETPVNMIHIVATTEDGTVYEGDVPQKVVEPIPTPTPTPDPIPTPDPVPNELPDYVPSVGTWREFTLNKPTDVNPVDPATGQKISIIYHGILANWCGGAFISDYGPHGAMAFQGGGEHGENLDRGGVLVLDIYERRFVLRNVPSVFNSQVMGTGAGGPSDNWGAFLNNGYPQRKHTYNGLQDFPSAWGGGPRGSLARVSHSGGISTSLPPINGVYQGGWSATWAYDLSQDKDGCTKLTGERTYDYGSDGNPDNVNDAICTGIDYVRKGWWSKPRLLNPAYGNGVYFTSHTGELTRYMNIPIGAPWNQIHHFADEDALFMPVAHVGSGAAPVITRTPDHADAKWIPLKVDGPADLIANGAFIGYMGMRWCDHPNYKCFVGIDYYNQINSTATALRINLLHPPADKFTGAWTWSEEIIESADGSTMLTRYPYAGSADHGLVNGVFGRFAYCPALRSMVFARSVAKPAQLVRLKRMD